MEANLHLFLGYSNGGRHGHEVTDSFTSSKIVVLYETTLNDVGSVDVPLREGPEIYSKRLFNIAPGTRIEILERGDIYYRARVGGTTGYVSKSFLKQK